VLTDHGARGERAAGHDGGDIGDAEAEVSAASHPRHAIEGPSGEHIGRRGLPFAVRDGRDGGVTGASAGHASS
jgi:hypothetical protein